MRHLSPSTQKNGSGWVTSLTRISGASSAPLALAAALWTAPAVPAVAQQERVLGIDVSAWQTNISTSNWATLKRPTNQQVNGVFGDGRDFVFIRSSRGGTTGFYNQSDPNNNNGQNTLSQRYDDPYFVQNITRATAAGLLAGSYHFARPDLVANTGVDEANHMIEMAGAWMRPGYLLPVLDLEAGQSQRTSAELTTFCIEFADRIAAVMGVRPAVYINGNYASYVQSSIVGALPDLWTARWPNQADPGAIDVQNGHPKDSYTPIYGPWDDAPNPIHPWKFWQYASTERLNGYANGGANIDVNVAQGGMEFIKDSLVPALWMNNNSGDWTTLSNWNSGLAPVAPVQGPGQVARVGPLTLPAERLPGSNDTVILDRPGASITVTLASGTHTVRKLYVRETLNITGGSLTANYIPSWDSTAHSAQFSRSVTLSGSGSLSLHSLLVDATRTFTLAGGTLTFNTINLTPHSSTPAKVAVTGNVNFTPLANATATITAAAGAGISGLVDLGGASRTFNVADGLADRDLSLAVPITNGALTKTGSGTLSLDAANTYGGGTFIQGGVVQLSGSLNSGVTVTSGTLALGATTGIRTVNGNLAVSAGGTLRIRLNGTTAGTQYDQLRVTSGAGTATLAGTLDLVAAPGLASGSTFRILDLSPSTTAVNGSFAGLPHNARFFADGLWWRISYSGGSGNDVVLTRITPTPWEMWQTTHFPTGYNDSAVAGELVDTDGDGFVHLAEYALGGNPALGGQSPLPQVSIIEGRLALTFTRTLSNTDITITVQGSDDSAGPWTNLAASVNGGSMTPLLGGVAVTETGTGATRIVEVRDLYLTTDPAHPKRFLRVQITKP